MVNTAIVNTAIVNTAIVNIAIVNIGGQVFLSLDPQVLLLRKATE
jgi:hypothetical protein